MFERAIEDTERRRAETLVASERQLSACVTKLAELEAYHEAYTRHLNERVDAGIGAVGLRDFQAFLCLLYTSRCV